MIKQRSVFLFLSFLFLFANFISCAPEFGNVVISNPDEYTHTYEASEKIILQSVARVFKEKGLGRSIRIDHKNNVVESDYVIQGDWRTKSIARVKKISWKECELSLCVITEKSTENGWEMRRLLAKEQYDKFFSVIDLTIYEEMARIE